MKNCRETTLACKILSRMSKDVIYGLPDQQTDRPYTTDHNYLFINNFPTYYEVHHSHLWLMEARKGESFGVLWMRL